MERLAFSRTLLLGVDVRNCGYVIACIGINRAAIVALLEVAVKITKQSYTRCESEKREGVRNEWHCRLL
jgi:hypothetical protein